jgi:hypothetical protein
MSNLLRWSCLAMMLTSGVVYLLTRQEMLRFWAQLGGLDKTQARTWGYFAEAYGPTFYYMLLMFVTAILMAGAIKASDQPYAPRRIGLTRCPVGASHEQPADIFRMT